MITRIHGATSTLAANPRGRHRKAKSHRAHRAHRAHAKRHNPKLTPEEKAAKLATRKAAALERLKKAQRALSKLSQAPARRKKAKKSMSAEKIAARRAAAATRAAKRSARSAKQAFRAEYGYNLKPLPAGAVSEGYVYRGKGGHMIVSDRLLRGKKSKPRYTLYKGASGKFGLHKNPAIGGVVFAGVPVIDMAIGSAATIAIGAISKKLITKFAPAVATSPVGDIAGELATAGVSALLYMKVLKKPMHKSIAQFAFIGAVFQILSKKLSPQIEDLVGKIPGLGGHYGSTHGIYFDPYTSTPAVGGAYLPTTAGTDIGGMYTNVDGLGLFNAPSIYG